MSAFTARPRTRTRLLAAATVALAALSLTACNDKLGVQDAGAASPNSSPVTTSAPSPSGTGTGRSGGSTEGSSTGGSSTGGSSNGGSSTGGGKGSGGSKTSGGSGSTSGSGSGSGSSTTRVTCSGANTKVTAQPVSRPINHMLLTVTNTGSKTCDLYYYPAVNFGDAQSVPPVIEDSQPQAVTTLAPGESGYAGVALSGGNDGTGTNGRTAKSLSVYFFDRNENSISPAATPALPTKGVYVDDSLRVTYWLASAQDALTY
ncbi:DUF4232 domain-containing protein [Streptomyces hokutonensis]|uniref:DUF4232 domain-containing protein n=1 Tax=Streptomyces hokutonensis TaxID=1306990 RepID=UPI000364EA28|nr:DUF4232 domain-containing protein [Streptomyces hokutonensis]